MEKEVIECERKWILWDNPYGKPLYPDTTKSLEYLYSPEGIRYQKESVDLEPARYLLIDKRDTHEESGKRIGSSREEKVSSISEEQFITLMTRPDFAYLSKIRHVYKFEEYKAEVDLYHQHNLITMEVEKVFSKDDEYWKQKAHIFESEKIPFPPKLEALILAEVTGREEFSNVNLARLYHKSFKKI